MLSSGCVAFPGPVALSGAFLTWQSVETMAKREQGRAGIPQLSPNPPPPSLLSSPLSLSLSPILSLFLCQNWAHLTVACRAHLKALRGGGGREYSGKHPPLRGPHLASLLTQPLAFHTLDPFYAIVTSHYIWTCSIWQCTDASTQDFIWFRIRLEFDSLKDFSDFCASS